MGIISNRLRPALGRITSSVASTASYGITRVLSFTDSFNEQTSLLLDAALTHEQESVASPPAVQSHDAAPALTTTIAAAFDIEAARTPAATRSGICVHGGGGGGQDPPPPAAQDAESKRVAKAVQTVCLFGASASLLLFVNPPRRGGAAGDGGGAMYRANQFFVCLGLLASLGLSMFSVIARPGEAAVARVQKWGMVAAVASVLAASALRMAVMVLPAASLEAAWVAAFALAGVVAGYLSLAWKFGGGRQADEASSSSGGSDRGAAGGVADPV